MTHNTVFCTIRLTSHFLQIELLYTLLCCRLLCHFFTNLQHWESLFQNITSPLWRQALLRSRPRLSALPPNAICVWVKYLFLGCLSSYRACCPPWPSQITHFHPCPSCWPCPISTEQKCTSKTHTQQSLSCSLERARPAKALFLTWVFYHSNSHDIAGMLLEIQWRKTIGIKAVDQLKIVELIAWYED